MKTDLCNLKLSSIHKKGLIVAFYARYEATWFVQLLYLLRRSYMNYYRNRRVVFYDFAMTILTALISGLIYYQLADEVNGICTFTQKNISNVSRALFFSLTFVIVVSLLSAVTVRFP